jgi:hypothetical protein
MRTYVVGVVVGCWLLSLVALVDWCWRMEALVLTVVSWNILVGARPVIRALPTSSIGGLESRRIVLAVSVVSWHREFSKAKVRMVVG